MEEEEIIKGCKACDKKAQRAFVDQYAPYLMGVCKRYIINHHTAEDMLQESLIIILNKIDMFKESINFKGWCSRITANVCLGYIRKMSNRDFLSLEKTQQVAKGAGIISKIEIKEIVKFLSTLPLNYRVALNMYLFEGFSHKEIAEQLDIGESSSRSLVSRGRKLIQENFDESIDVKVN